MSGSLLRGIALAVLTMVFAPVASAQGPASRLGSPTGSPPAAEEPPPPAAPAPDDEPTTTEPTAPDDAEPATEPAAETAPSDASEAAPAAPEAEGEVTDGSIGEEFAAPAETGPPRLRMLVIDAATFGIDPVVGRVASAQMRSTAEEMGYAVRSPAATVAAWQQLRATYPPTPADLWRVSWVARVHRGAFARIWAHAGAYVIEVTVASLDGTGPFFARGTSGADDLREVVDQLLRTALPPPSSWSESGAQAVGGTPAPGEGDDQPVAAPAPSTMERATSDRRFDIPRRRRRARPAPPLGHQWGLTAVTESAFGVSNQFFYNHVLGLRLSFRLSRAILLGAYVAYTNLNGRDGRANNVLMMLQFEDRIRIASSLDLTLPLRVAVGYLPFNGPVIRLAAGLQYAVSPGWDIGADLIAPTFWILPDGNTSISLNVGLEATYRF